MNLIQIFGDEVPSKTRVYRWSGEFNRGHRILQNEFREGRPQSAVIPETIDALQDCHITYREI